MWHTSEYWQCSLKFCGIQLIQFLREVDTYVGLSGLSFTRHLTKENLISAVGAEIRRFNLKLAINRHRQFIVTCLHYNLDMSNVPCHALHPTHAARIDIKASRIIRRRAQQLYDICTIKTSQIASSASSPSSVLSIRKWKVRFRVWRQIYAWIFVFNNEG